MFTHLKALNLTLLRKDYILSLFTGIIVVLHYLPHYRNFLLAGDDLVLIYHSPKDFRDTLHELINFSGQYRPFSHLFFSIYNFFLPNINLMLFIHLCIFLIICILWYFQLRRIVSPLLSGIFTIITFLSPVFFYHFFALASLNNLFLIIAFLSMLHLLQIPSSRNLTLPSSKKVILAIIILLFSIGSKETFLPVLLLFYLITFQNLNRNKAWLLSLGVSLLVTTYGVLHITLYEAMNDYEMQFNVREAFSSSLNFLSWFIGYPRGWQYGAPIVKNVITYLTTAVAIMTWSYFLLPLLRIRSLWKEWFVFVSVLSSSLVLYLFFRTSFPFYLDIPFLWLIFSLLYFVKSNHSKHQLLFVSFFLILSVLLQHVLYFSPWSKYSFVANSQTVARLYKDALEKYNYQAYGSICIFNNIRGSWGSFNGKAASMVYGYEGNILSITDPTPEKCPPSSLILYNDGWNFIPYSEN